MKAIISHDVDHLTVWEHGCDGIILKHVVRNIIELGMGYVTPGEVLHRLRDIGRNSWQNLDALMQFNEWHGVPATFFFGVAQGVGLRYSVECAASWIEKIVGRGFDVGAHGIAFDRSIDITREYEIFSEVSRQKWFGVRMHYLRMAGETLDLLGRAGYSFDSSVPGLVAPYSMHGLWEFPLHIMDGYIMCGRARWQCRSLSESVKVTRGIIEDAAEAGVGYLTVDFHDRYFTESFRTWKAWYRWLIGYLKDNGIRCVSYRQAMDELEGQKRK